MTSRDRIVLMVVAIVVVLGGVWVKVVSPERKQAAKAVSEVSAANARLQSVEGELASARSAQSSYATAYASLVELGKAVPPQAEVPALVFQLSAASHVKNVAFASISNSTSSSSSSSSGSASTKAGAATTFTSLPFTLGFEGGFHELAGLLEEVEGFTKNGSSGNLDITGRLLTIQSLRLGPGGSNATTKSSMLIGTITATAYALPASASGGSGSSPSSSPTPAAGSASPSSPTTPAVARVTP
ncbi:MAG TPA: type II secretion system protein GspM [Solirubrobacteraceae bacterium]|nr:type II secretion system protein GspM [Solirubrobacteraceae bacterium]